jgi:hypothetical protein
LSLLGCDAPWRLLNPSRHSQAGVAAVFLKRNLYF